MEFFQLKRDLQHLILEQTRQALYNSILALNAQFSHFIKFYDFSKEELYNEERTLTTLLEKAISKSFTKQFNTLSSISGITIDTQTKTANYGKDYLLLIPKNIRQRETDVPMHIEQKINTQKHGKWTGNKLSKKCNALLLIEIGKIDFHDGVVEIWAGIFDKSKATNTSWGGSTGQRSGSSTLQLSIKDQKHLHILLGEIDVTTSKRGGKKRKYIKPVYYKIP
jgi:hypothetical protein